MHNGCAPQSECNQCVKGVSQSEGGVIRYLCVNSVLGLMSLLWCCLSVALWRALCLQSQSGVSAAPHYQLITTSQNKPCTMS